MALRNQALARYCWCGAAPDTWKPTYADRGTTREVILHIHNPIGGEEIYRATDTYPLGSYEGRTERTVPCTGDQSSSTDRCPGASRCR